MQSKAATVEQYLASLPADRRAAVEAVRRVIRKNLDKQYEEGMLYGMIGYYVPHSVYPAGYHCDPSKPLCFAMLGSQKNYCSLYLMSVYGSDQERAWFEGEWKKSGKKLDMGKACLRFADAGDLALDVIGESVRRVPARAYIERVEKLLASRPGKGRAGASRTAPKKAGKRVAKKALKKTAKRAASRPAAKARR
jgi:hypothetical protein